MCRSDGVLFRPARPATAIDSTFLSDNGPKGEMWHTYGSDDNENLFVEYVMITNLTQSYPFTWDELYSTQDDDTPRRVIVDNYVAFDLNHPMNYYWLTSKDPSSTISMPTCPQNPITFYSPYHLYVFIPYFESSEWILFGELNKQLPITKQRFQSVSFESISSLNQFQVDVIGVSGEQVFISLGQVEQVFGKITMTTVVCSFDSQSVLSTMSILCDKEHGCRCG